MPVPEQMYVLKLSQDVIKGLLACGFSKQNKDGGAVSAIFTWHSKIPAGTTVCVVETGQQGRVACLATLSSIQCLNNFAQLRASKSFMDANNMQRQTWRNRIVEENKILYEWTFSKLLVPDVPMQAPVNNARNYWIEGNELQRSSTLILPDMNLRSTAAYFVGRLSLKDRELLQATMKALHSKTITYGSTCSGTDVCICVMKATFAELCKIFEAIWWHPLVTFLNFQMFFGIYIYIQSTYSHLFIYLFIHICLSFSTVD